MPTADEERLGRGIAGGLLHLDDPERMRWMADQRQRPVDPDSAGFDSATERIWRMLMAQLRGCGRQHVPLAKALVRLLAAANLRAEGFGAFSQLDEARPLPGCVAEGFCAAVGVFFDEATRGDVFFITLKKSERLFSTTTRYNDYAISPREFHWESQSLTREASSTGQSYIRHRERGSCVMLFIREENKRSGVTMPFHCLGFTDDVSHQGERPMTIRWRLQRPIPGVFYPELAVVV